jgi:GH43 family beta-xylosidase
VIRLRAGASALEIEAEFTNHKDLPLEYYYLCHINHLPVDGSKLLYTADPAKAVINREVPEGYRKDWAEATEKWLDEMEKDLRCADVVGAENEAYRPEIVNCFMHSAAKDGWAYTMQQHPDGSAIYVKHNPKELPYGTRWIAFKNTSGDLRGEWEELGVVAQIPQNAETNYWAPEVHKYNGAYYMFTTYRSSVTGHRGCTIMKSDSPEGPFVEITDGHITPNDWDSIDGTFYVDPDGQPWMIFVHEWTSTDDGIGRMAAAKLSDDLTHFISEPVELFRADDPSWSKAQVTDGCWMYRTEDGQLLMLWSNSDRAGYCVGIARSADGRVDGTWTQDKDLLYSQNMAGMKYDGGHGMLFYDTDGQMYLSIHSPNNSSAGRVETPVFIPVREDNGTIVWDFWKKK